MNNKRFDDQINNYYQDQKLSADKLEKLLSLTDTTDQLAAQSKEQTKNIWQRRYSIAASVCLFVLISLQFTPNNFLFNAFQKKELAILVSEEIALNHNKQLAIEFSAKNFAELRKQMKKLDFTPISSAHLENSGLSFLGARYCSIQGQLAAQIKLKNKKGVIQTLYQTQLNANLKTLPVKSYLVNGVRIKQWQEKGLFFGLAETAE